MVIDLTWNVLKDVVGWAASAHQAAKTKNQQRYANVVEHAGVLVAGVNRLNGQVVTLLKPLVYFDPSEWDAKSRAELARDLILFGEESVVVPRMRAARSALRALFIDIDDQDVRQPLQDILYMAEALFWAEDCENQPGWSENSTTGMLLHPAGLDLYGPDAILSGSFPELLELIRPAQDPYEVEMLHGLAQRLTTVKVWDLRNVAYRVLSRDVDGIDHATEEGGLPNAQDIFEQLPARSVLAPYAAEMQAAFGRLVAAQQRVFPALPSPSWAI